VMAGLDVTHKAQIHREDTERFRAIGNPISTIVAELLDFFFEYHKGPSPGRTTSSDIRSGDVRYGVIRQGQLSRGDA